MECIKRIAWKATSVWLVLASSLALAQSSGETLMREGIATAKEALAEFLDCLG